MTRKQNDIPAETLVLVAAVALGVLGAITAVGTALYELGRDAIKK